VPYPLDINAFHLSWRPTEGLLTTDLLFCQKIRNAPHPATEPTIKNIAHPSISVLPNDQRVKRKKHQPFTRIKNQIPKHSEISSMTFFDVIVLAVKSLPMTSA
jgi:hypothetical protein